MRVVMELQNIGLVAEGLKLLITMKVLKVMVVKMFPSVEATNDLGMTVIMEVLRVVVLREALAAVVKGALTVKDYATVVEAAAATLEVKVMVMVAMAAAKQREEVLNMNLKVL